MRKRDCFSTYALQLIYLLIFFFVSIVFIVKTWHKIDILITNYLLTRFKKSFFFHIFDIKLVNFIFFLHSFPYFHFQIKIALNAIQGLIHYLWVMDRWTVFAWPYQSTTGNLPIDFLRIQNIKEEKCDVIGFNVTIYHHLLFIGCEIDALVG